MTILSTEEKARIALSNRLYISGWELNGALHEAIEHPDYYVIELKQINDEYVAVALLDKTAEHIQVFVRLKYRRQGIGTELVNKIKNEVQSDVYAGEGIRGSIQFWDKLDIPCFDK